MAGDNEIFVHFSEPIEKPLGGVIDATDFTYNADNPTSINRITISGIGTEEVLLTLGSPVTVNEVFNQQALTTTALQDMAATPNALVPPAHRVSDVGLGQRSDKARSHTGRDRQDHRFRRL
ncbi:hypothetical protein ES703_38775 [subsurface metagenome]